MTYVSMLEDLFDVAKQNGIFIIEENLGNQIAGYYHFTSGEKLIHVNSELLNYEDYLRKLLDIAVNETTTENYIRVLPIA